MDGKQTLRAVSSTFHYVNNEISFLFICPPPSSSFSHPGPALKGCRGQSAGRADMQRVRIVISWINDAVHPLDAKRIGHRSRWRAVLSAPGQRLASESGSCDRFRNVPVLRSGGHEWAGPAAIRHRSNPGRQLPASSGQRRADCSRHGPVSTDGCLQRTDGLSGPAGLSAMLTGQQFQPFAAICRLDCRFLDDSLHIRTVKKKTELGNSEFFVSSFPNFRLPQSFDIVASAGQQRDYPELSQH